MNSTLGRSTPARNAEDEYVLPLKDLLQILWKRLWIVVLAVVLAVGVAEGFTFMQTPQYEASIKILVGQEGGIIGPQGDVNSLQMLTKTMSEAVVSRPVAEATVKKLDLQKGPEYLLSNLSAEPVGDTQFILVSYTDPDPERARLIANTVGSVFSEKVSDLSPDTAVLTATVWERAEVPSEPVSPDPVRNGLLAMVLGGMLGVALALLLEFLDDSWRSPEEAEQVSGVPTLGVIPVSQARGDKEGQKIPGGIELEHYRVLRANLLYALVDGPSKAIMVTSAGPREGKTTVCANLGLVLAQAGKRTLIVDCDLRRPEIHKFFGLQNLHGLVDALVGDLSLQEVLQEPLPGLRVMTAGPIPPTPAELLGSARFAELLKQLRGEFDYVLMDVTPIRVVSDPAILAPMADGVLLVVDSQNTRKASVRRSIRSLETAGANVLGTVMTKVKVPKGGY